MVLADNGDLVDASTYQPYGKMVPVVTGTESVRERFTGKELDKEGAVYDGSGVQIAAGMGLQYFGARYYDAETGVWTSGDPKGQYFNAYAYTANGTNPIIFIDENGEWLGALIGSLAGAYLGGAMSNGFEFNPGQWDWENPGTYMGMVGGGISGAQIGNSIEMSMVGTSGNLSPAEQKQLVWQQSNQPSTTKYIQTGDQTATPLDRFAGQKLSSHIDHMKNNAWHRALGHDKLEYKIGASYKGDYKIIAGYKSKVITRTRRWTQRRFQMQIPRQRRQRPGVTIGFIHLVRLGAFYVSTGPISAVAIWCPY